jgi:hypothetical protein
MNQYGSITRTLTARNVLEKSLNPPSTVSVLPADWAPQIFQDGIQSNGTPYWMTGSNILLKRIGLFSNFADGLVWNTPSQRLKILIQAVPYNIGAVVPGTQHLWAANSKSLFGMGTTYPVDIPAGSIVKNVTGGAPSPQLGIVMSTPAVGLALMSDYGPGGDCTTTLHLVSVAGQVISTYLLNVSQLNTMYEHEMYMPASVLGGNLTSFFLKATVLQGNGNDPALQSMDFLTKTVDPLFAGDIASFDVVADIEMTSNGTI